MTAELLFSVANLLALASWIAMAILPRWHATPNIVAAAAILLLSMLYLFLIVLFFGQADGGFGTLAQVKRLFANDFAALAGWLHYLSRTASAFPMAATACRSSIGASKGATYGWRILSACTHFNSCRFWRWSLINFLLTEKFMSFRQRYSTQQRRCSSLRKR